MSHSATTARQSALHQVHTATNDVLEGYGVMLDRAQPEIEPILTDLKAMHERHAADHAAHLAGLGEDGSDDTSLRATMNKAAVTVRDWVSDLDAQALPAVHRGEAALLDIYEDAISELSEAEDPGVRDLLTRQHEEIGQKMRGLPAA